MIPDVNYDETLPYYDYPELTPVESVAELDFLFQNDTFPKPFWSAGRWNESAGSFDHVFDRSLEYTEGKECVMVNETGQLGNDSEIA